MWTCAACGVPNEPHAIFCSSCGAMRYKAPVRESSLPEPAAELPPPDPPEFRGTIAGFAAAWVGVTLAAGFGAWISQSILSFSMRFSSGTSEWSMFAVRMAFGVVFGFVFGGLLGTLQSWVLRRRIQRAGWNAWIFATLGGIVAMSVGSNLMPVSMWGDTGVAARIGMASIVGLIAGGLVGLLQSRVLSRVAAPGGWTGWWLVSAGAFALGNAAGLTAWSLVFDSSEYSYPKLMLAGLANMLCDSSITGLLTGLPLARMLRRRCPPLPEA